MKKFISILLTLTILLCLVSFNVSATNYNEEMDGGLIISETTEYLKDGSSITTTITQYINQKQSRATKTVSGNKTITSKNADDEVLFKFKINGTFSVNEGVSATCTAVSCSASYLASGWSLDSSTTSKTGNKASATGVFKHKVLFITNVTQEVSGTLSCDKNGVLS